jgi:hypothetical protein
MASTTLIDGSLPDQATNATKGIIFAGGWSVEYDWQADRATSTGQPKRLSSLSFPAPFDSNLEGALRGRGSFSNFLYLFKNGQYLRLLQSTMAVDGIATATAPAWDLPADWTSFDAVLPGRGAKIDFCYFFRRNQYIRFDWNTNRRSPNYPKFIAPEWHTTAPFIEDFDGVIVGQNSFDTKGYLFKTLPATVDKDGRPVALGTPGSKNVQAPGYIRYDFNAENTQGAEINPFVVVTLWPGLLPLLDAGKAVDTALDWCNAALAALANPSTPVVTTALSHHFMTATPTPAQLNTIASQMRAIRDRLRLIPDRFQWTPGLAVAAQTIPQTLTEIGDSFSTEHGPNGRAAVMIHEAVHFIFTGGLIVDVPEWSGETVNGTPFGIAAPIPGVISNIAYHTMTTDQAINNPSSYSAFAQEIFFTGVDARFGIARPHE